MELIGVAMRIEGYGTPILDGLGWKHSYILLLSWRRRRDLLGSCLRQTEWNRPDHGKGREDQGLHWLA